LQKRKGIHMAQISTNEMKNGMKVEVDSQPYVIVSNDYVKPGKGQAFNRLKLKNIITGRVIERTLKSGDKLDLADITEIKMRMLYKEQDGVVFMDDVSFEQSTISNDHLSEVSKWLKEDLVYDIIFYKGIPIAVEPPTFMDFTIVETAPGDRGNTASGRVMKSAIVDNGTQVQVPIFIEEKEKVRIDTRTGEYVSRI